MLKGLDSLLEIAGGVTLLFISPDLVNHLAQVLTEHELDTDPHDYIANHILHAAHHFTAGGRYFGAAYLLSHGLVKIVLIIALFKEKLWAYPWMIAVIFAFIVYQIYRMSYSFSLGLLLLTVFDVFVIVLTWLEYKRHSVRLAAKKSPEKQG
ncbi:MAG TPA: DUF2127 domain-containing protein [Nitrococcus sp.]|nr:DUF2127 domain-containing protein [Nitrococcus sp.]